MSEKQRHQALVFEADTKTTRVNAAIGAAMRKRLKGRERDYGF
jgi:hypothetical protein